MKDIDPDVAALLNENPATLPEAVVRAGWGVQSIKDTGLAAKTPSDVVAPVFNETCVQCGRPIARGHRGYMDHAGTWHCVADLVDNPVSVHHVPQADWDLLDAMREPVKLKPLVQPAAPCQATKHDFDHSHQCFHPTGHFGFHECLACRKLWG